MKKSNVFLNALFFIIFHASFWICSVPAWLTLILHFTCGLSIWFFWGTLALWLLSALVRYLMVLFGRWGSTREEPYHENKNPYSAKNSDLPSNRNNGE